ncbi:MAG: hypothetical protein ACREMY_29395 [bacterium]
MPVFGVYVLGWAPISVVFFYALDIVLRVPAWVAYVQRGLDELARPRRTARQRRAGTVMFTFIGLLPVLALIFISGLYTQGSVFDLLWESLPSTRAAQVQFIVAVAFQILASAWALRLHEVVPAKLEYFEAQMKYRFVLLLARSLLLLPLSLILAAADRFAVVVLAIALTVYDANPRFFLKIMALAFKDRDGKTFWTSEDDAAQTQAEASQAARTQDDKNAREP